VAEAAATCSPSSLPAVLRTAAASARVTPVATISAAVRTTTAAAVSRASHDGLPSAVHGGPATCASQIVTAKDRGYLYP